MPGAGRESVSVRLLSLIQNRSRLSLSRLSQMLDVTGSHPFLKSVVAADPKRPVEIDADTRDIVQNVYIRKVEKKDGALFNVEFETIPMVKDPFKASKK